MLSIVSLLIALPLIVTGVFAQSEKATRHWLGIGFDTDMELLEMITSGKIAETKIVAYLQFCTPAAGICASCICWVRSRWAYGRRRLKKAVSLE